MDRRLHQYSVLDAGSSGVYRTVGSQSDGVDLAAAAAAFYPDSGTLPSCHQLRSPRTASVVDSTLDSTPSSALVSRDFVTRTFYDTGGAGRPGVTAAGTFWDRPRRSSFLPDSMAPAVLSGGGYDGVVTLHGETRPCRNGDNIIGKDTEARASNNSVSSASCITSSMTSSSSLPRKKKPIGRRRPVISTHCYKADMSIYFSHVTLSVFLYSYTKAILFRSVIHRIKSK